MITCHSAAMYDPQSTNLDHSKGEPKPTRLVLLSTHIADPYLSGSGLASSHMECLQLASLARF